MRHRSLEKGPGSGIGIDFSGPLPHESEAVDRP